MQQRLDIPNHQDLMDLEPGQTITMAEIEDCGITKAAQNINQRNPLRHYSRRTTIDCHGNPVINITRIR